MWQFVRNGSPRFTRTNASERFTAPLARRLLTSLPSSTSPASHLSRISKRKRAWRFVEIGRSTRGGVGGRFAPGGFPPGRGVDAGGAFLVTAGPRAAAWGAKRIADGR